MTLAGEGREIAWPGDGILLEALFAAGIEAPHSCKLCLCGSCLCTLLTGAVTLAENDVLTQTDVDEDYILACLSYPGSDFIDVEF